MKLVAGFLLALILGCFNENGDKTEDNHSKVQKESQASAASEKKSERFSIFDSPYTDTVVAAIDGYKVTEEQLRRFYARTQLRQGAQASHWAGNSSDQISLEDVFKAFTEYWAVIFYGLEDDALEKKETLSLTDFYEISMYANDYKDKLRQDMSVLSEAELKGVLPTKWVKMDFEIKVFDSIGEAKKIYDKLSAKEISWKDVKGTVKTTAGEKKSTTGNLFPDSGFFDSIDDAYLFGLNEGDLSEPVRSGIGPALVRVIARVDLDSQAIDQYLSEQKERIISTKLQKLVAEKVKDVRPKINIPVLTQAVQNDVENGVVSDESIAEFENGTKHLTYSGLKLLVPMNLRALLSSYPEESWGKIVAIDIVNFAKLYRLGTLGKAAGVKLNPKWRKEAYDFKLEQLHSAALKMLAEKNTGAYSDELVSKYIEENPEILTVPPRVKIHYFYAPESAQLEDFISNNGGTPEAVFNSVEAKSNEVIFSKDSKVWGEMFVQIDNLKPGEIDGPIAMETGYYIIRLDERQDEMRLAHEAVFENVRAMLVQRDMQLQVKQIIEKRVAAMNVEFLLN